MTEAGRFSLARELPATFRDSMRYFASARLLIATVLAVLVPIWAVVGEQAIVLHRSLFQSIAWIYVALAILWLVLLPASRRRPPSFSVALLHTQVLLDILILTSLVYAAGPLRISFGLLLMAPLAATAILATPRSAMFYASLGAFLLLVQSLWTFLHDDVQEGLIVQAALIGATLIVTAFIVSQLAQRLAAEESLAARRGADLRNQLALNERVLAEMADGVAVFSPDGRLRALNPAAQALLAANQNNLERTRLFAFAAPDTEQANYASPKGADHPVRLRRLVGPEQGGDRVVIIEDQWRAQQAAQDLKLASMGRFSAAIAHEIRNPLGAIGHANALLAERIGGADEGAQRRLSEIIGGNTQRINRIIEDVLSVARREPARRLVLDPRQVLPTMVAEYLLFDAQSADGRIRVDVRSDTPIYFDPNQLKQVVSNLLSNALRYCSGAQGAVVLRWQEQSAGPLELIVADDGPGPSPEIRAHLFEPFSTSEASGTGLGLYFAQELCRSNAASIGYRDEPESTHPRCFVIRPVRAQTALPAAAP